ncbi:hypothetical protein GCM10027053_35560 [Intrasporangium mesophilum]
MSVQGDAGHGNGSTPDGPTHGGPDPWTSSLWADPKTVGGYARASAVPPPGYSPPPPPQQRPPRRRMLVAVLALIALLAGGAALAGALQSPSNTTAAPPKPSATVLPSPTPSSSPSVPAPSAPRTSEPAAPPGGAPESPGSPPNGAQQPNTQSKTLTPQQAAAAAAVSKGLVDINTSIGYDGSRGAGTGIVLSADGLVLTNHHVVAGATKIQATDVGNAKTYDATVLGYDSTHDVAVLRLKDASGLTVAPLGTSSTVHVGDAVVAVGNAGGVGGTPSAVAGAVLGLDQPITVTDETDGSTHRLTGLIQFDAAVQPGDSGGALVDAAGKVVGVVTAEGRAASSSDVSVSVEGFAIPIDQARSIGQQIIDGKSSATVHVGATGFLGVQLASGQRATSNGGVLVGSVVSGSAAEQAGIQPGDVITSVAGQTLSSAADLKAAVSAHRPGDDVKVAWTDPTGQKHTASIRLGTGPVG